MKKHSKLIALMSLFIMFIASQAFTHPIDDYYNKYKNDQGMEAKKVPPKLASLFVDEDYPEAIDVLQSLSALKYLNFYGDKSQIEQYATHAISSKGSYKELLKQKEGSRIVHVYGEKKRGKVRKIIAIVQTKSQFLLLIGKGKLSKKQIAYLPALSKEIQ